MKIFLKLTGIETTEYVGPFDDLELAMVWARANVRSREVRAMPAMHPDEYQAYRRQREKAKA